MGWLGKNYHKAILAGIIIVALAIRLYFAFQTPYFSDDSSYFALRQIEEISSTGTPLFNDDLSYGGRTYMFTPLFHYILAAFTLFLPSALVGKLIPNIFAVSLVVISYLLAMEISKDRQSALVVAMISAFIPILFSQTVNSISLYSLVIPLFALSILLFIKMHKDMRYGYPLVGVISALAFIHPSALLLVLAFSIYLILLKLEDIKESKAEIEVVLFSFMLVIWVLLILYKNSIMKEGLSIIWQSIPASLLPVYFSSITILGAIASIGVIPFVYGIVTIYRYLFRKKTRFTYLFISFALLIGMLMIFNGIMINIGLMFLGMVLTILYSIHYKQSRDFLSRTKLSRLKTFFMITLVIAIIASQLLPSVYLAQGSIKDAPSEEKIASFIWISQNTDPESTVLSAIDDGHKIAYFAQRKNIIDSNFMGVNDAEQRLSDISAIYRSIYLTNAIELLNKYDIRYIMFSDEIAEYYGIESIRYIEDPCFEIIYVEEDIRIYRSLCRFGESQSSL